jgi:hypothetical protein
MGNLWVRRTASGNYQFSAEQGFKDYNEHRKQVSELLTNLPAQLGLQVNTTNQMFIGGNWQTFHQMSFEEIESLLVFQLRSIAFFNKTYSLLDVLPDIIKVEHLKQSPNSLTTALIEYLGKDRVDRLLNSENPIERRKLLSEL